VIQKKTVYDVKTRQVRPQNIHATANIIDYDPAAKNPSPPWHNPRCWWYNTFSEEIYTTQLLSKKDNRWAQNCIGVICKARSLPRRQRSFVTVYERNADGKPRCVPNINAHSTI